MISKTMKEELDKDSVFIYIPDFLSKKESLNLYTELNNITDIKKNYNFDNNKIIRLQKWYHTENKYFCPKWKYKYDRWTSNEYDPSVLNIQKYVQSEIQKMNLEKYNITIPNINSCLLNKYRDGNDYIRPHHDTELTFGKYPTIIGLSIGHSRDIIFKNKINKDIFKFTLESGSLFIMAGSSQKYYTHEIPKSNIKYLKNRFSLTFRETF